MASKRVTVHGNVQFTAMQLAVTAVAGTTGAAVEYSAPTTAVMLANTSRYGVEYRVGLGDWKYIGANTAPHVHIDMSAVRLYFRRVNDGSTSVDMELTFEGAPEYSVGGSKTPANAPITSAAAKLMTRNQRWLFVGDSIFEYATFVGTFIGGTGALPGLVSQGADIGTPAGNCTLVWDWKAGTLAYGEPGDTVGAPVPVTTGVFYTPSGTSGRRARWGVKLSGMPAANVTLTNCATGVTQCARKTGSIIHAFEAACYGAVDILPPLAIAGLTTVDMVRGMVDQIIASPADVVVLEPGINDIILLDEPPASIVGRITDTWDRVIASGKLVVQRLLSPMWGKLADGSAGSYAYNATRQASITEVNRRLIMERAKRNGVLITDPYRRTTDSSLTTGQIRDGYTIDGLHANGGLAQEDALSLYEIADMLTPIAYVVANSGGGSQYNAVTAPGGNHLPGNQGSLAGVGGTAGAGVTIGTGLAAGLNCARASGAAATAIANKVPDVGGGEWQELAISGAAVLGETFALYFGNPPVGNFTPGDVVQWSAEFQILGSGCYGVYAQYAVTGGPGITVEARQLRNVISGVRIPGGELRTEPFTWQPGITAIAPQLFVQSLIGASFSVRFRNAQFRKVGV